MYSKVVVLIFLFGFLPSLFAADSVNAGPWTGSAEGSYSMTTGNTDTHNIGTAAELNYKPDSWSGQIKGNYLTNYSNGNQTAEALNLSLRGSKKLSELLEAFVQGAYFRNPYSGINDRYSPEAGIELTLLNGKPHLLSVEAAVGYLIEHRLPVGGREFADLRLGGSYRWKFSDDAEFFDDVSFTLDSKQSEDWRASNMVGVAVAMNRVLSLKLSYGLQYMNVPVPGFQTTDTVTAAALIAKF